MMGKYNSNYIVLYIFWFWITGFSNNSINDNGYFNVLALLIAFIDLLVKSFKWNNCNIWFNLLFILNQNKATMNSVVVKIA